MINKVTLIGNLGQDPELKHLDSGISVCRLSLCTNKNIKNDKDEWTSIPTWHNVILWRDLAERAYKRLKKGHQVYIEGEISYRRVGEGADSKYYTDIVVRLFRPLTKLESNEMPSEAPPAPVEAVNTHTPTPPAVVADDDDLPF